MTPIVHRVEMFCGFCDCNLTLESDQGESLWLMAHRFANAHSECGFMTQVVEDKDAGYSFPAKTRVIKPRRKDPEE